MAQMCQHKCRQVAVMLIHQPAASCVAQRQVEVLVYQILLAANCEVVLFGCIACANAAGLQLWVPLQICLP